MKATFVFMLVAVLATLPFTLASPTNLGLRQSASLEACLQTPNCKSAASSWIDCQTATFSGTEFAPDYPQKNCLCYNGQGSTPSHPDWYPNLMACIKCVGSAGFDDTILGPLWAWEVNFCDTGLLSYNDFVVEAHNTAIEFGFPLEMPNVVYVSTQTSISAAPALPTKHKYQKDDAAVSPIVIGSQSPAQTDTCLETSSASKTTANPLTQTSSQTSTHAASVSAPTAPVAHGCNYDNCLRQAIQSEVAVLPFCKSYTTAAQTATAGYPAYISMCNNQPSSISSACTCLVSAQTPAQSSTAAQPETTTQAASVTHTTTNAGVATTETSHHQSVHYTTVVIWTTVQYTDTIGAGGGDHSSTSTGNADTTCTTTSENSSPVSSPHSSTTTLTASTTVEKSSRSTSFYSTTTRTTLVTVTQSSSSAHSSTSTHVSSSTPSTPSSKSTEASSSVSSTHSSTSTEASSASVTSSSSAPAVSSSTSSSAAPASNTWVTLPPSDGIKACAASQDCTNGASIYNQCSQIEVNGNQTGSWNCFCETNNAAWKSSLIACAACVQKNLPTTGGLPTVYLTSDMTTLLNTFCNITDAGIKSIFTYRLNEGGVALTDAYESPIDFFNMTLIEAPPTEPVAPSSTSTLVSSSSTTSTSTTATTTPTNWITLPATDAMKQCQSNTCQPAARVFNSCAFIQLNTTNEDPIFDCFCTTQKALWHSSLQDCSSCIAAALPAHNPATGQYQASVLDANVETVFETYCNQTDGSMASGALSVIGAFGNIVTTSFQLPIEFFGMTLLTAPLAPVRKRDNTLIPLALLEGS